MDKPDPSPSGASAANASRYPADVAPLDAPLGRRLDASIPFPPAPEQDMKEAHADPRTIEEAADLAVGYCRHVVTDRSHNWSCANCVVYWFRRLAAPLDALRRALENMTERARSKIRRGQSGWAVLVRDADAALAAAPRDRPAALDVAVVDGLLISRSDAGAKAIDAYVDAAVGAPVARLDEARESFRLLGEGLRMAHGATTWASCLALIQGCQMHFAEVGDVIGATIFGDN